ncbi:MAG: alpha/beta fold hydrolase [Afipia sp.]|nr:alpha/beta fold hydrolase [Afipia sp.]OJW61884.1 MAG: alpha/beta hydrolase [Afipia sp. 64-13]
MKRGLIIVLALCVVAVGGYLTASKWAIRHETLHLYDAARHRPVDVDVAIRRDIEMRADAGMKTLPVAVINHGNTVRFTEYSFLANLFAARGYLAISIQHDLSTDAPLVTKVGERYVGREPVYERGVANILFALDEIHKVQPQADIRHLVMIGHSNGGDISMYFAEKHPALVKKVVTLDNLRVPLAEGAFKILSFRSTDPHFKPDPGVVPSDEECRKAGIKVVTTRYQHTDMSDRGPESLKVSIENELSKFLTDDSALAPVNTDKIEIPKPPGPVARVAPRASN